MVYLDIGIERDNKGEKPSSPLGLLNLQGQKGERGKSLELLGSLEFTRSREEGEGGRDACACRM